MVHECVLGILHQLFGRWFLALLEHRSLLDDGRDFVLSGDHRLAIFKAHELLNVLKLLVGDLGLSKVQFIIILDLSHDFCLRLGVHRVDRLQSLGKILFL